MLRAFEAENAAVRRLPGGQGTTWATKDLVLKPGSGQAQEWQATVLARVTTEGFRLAPAVPTRDGAWACQGWTAFRWVDGAEPDRSAPSTWVAIVETGRAFHRAVAQLTRPAFLDARTDRWALADRAAWGERIPSLRPELTEVVRRLRAGLEPLGHPQLVHGDLTTNVLFAPGLSPAVIDISAYWRATRYAEGMVVADALCWHDATADLLELADVSVAAVARALLFRTATTNARTTSDLGSVDLQEEVRRYSLAATAIGL